MLFPKGSVGSSPTFGTKKTPDKIGGLFSYRLLAKVCRGSFVDRIADAVDAKAVGRAWDARRGACNDDDLVTLLGKTFG